MNTSAVQPFQFEPERTVGLNQENNADIDRPTQELHENEDYQRVEEARVGQNRCCLRQFANAKRERVFAVKSYTFCQQLSWVGYRSDDRTIGINNLISHLPPSFALFSLSSHYVERIEIPSRTLFKILPRHRAPFT